MEEKKLELKDILKETNLFQKIMMITLLGSCVSITAIPIIILVAIIKHFIL
ncbi:hypothetical protein CLPU_22c00070 [Gottschalkia purinilytica]|uniref:Lipoprotein n=1 Tax=Gottschalkia purinilytica TaxID=1503 RepID=A0A0L0W7A1_GOTPU|nr:hypothetical protein [Gottschalkia purinilytica]KNF07155.1 hypothetical protein CLPU_22c00070 [Gottschalkia purinilytica]